LSLAYIALKHSRYTSNYTSVKEMKIQLKVFYKSININEIGDTYV